MGATIKDFLASASQVAGPARTPSRTLRLPKSNYIGAFLVPKNLLPAIGSATTYTPPGGTAVTVTVANIISILTTLSLNGLAYAFPNRTITGKRGAFKSDEESTVFGSQRTAEDTGEGEIAYTIMYKYAYHNTEFMNQLRLMSGLHDIYLFTDRSVEVLRADLVEPTYKEVKNGEIAGSNKNVVDSGGWNIVVGADGDIVPDFGLFEAGLNLDNFRYRFGAPVVTGTGLTSTLSGTVITKTSSGSGTIASAVTQAVQAGTITYSAYLDGGAALPALLTIDSVTGTLTVGAGLVAGSYKVVVAAENATGITGQYNFTLVAA